MTVAELHRNPRIEDELDLSVLQESPEVYKVQECVKYPKTIEKYLDPRVRTTTTCMSDEQLPSLVLKAEDLRTGDSVAIKQYFNKGSNRDIEKEAKLQYWLANNKAVRGGVLPVIGVEQYSVSHNLEPSPALVTPWHDGGSYYGKMVRKGSESDLREAFSSTARVAGVLAVMASEDLVHGDVKPANILRGGILMDYGSAMYTKGAKPKQRTYTAGYTPHEVLNEGSVTPEGDVFGVTLSFYTILTGSLPYVQQAGEGFYEYGVAHPIKGLRNKLPMLPAETIEIVEANTDPNPQNRGTAAEFRDHLLSQL